MALQGLRCYHSASVPYTRDRVFKLSPIHAFDIFWFPELAELTEFSFKFRKTTIGRKHLLNELIFCQMMSDWDFWKTRLFFVYILFIWYSPYRCQFPGIIHVLNHTADYLEMSGVFVSVGMNTSSWVGARSYAGLSLLKVLWKFNTNSNGADTRVFYNKTIFTSCKIELMWANLR